MSQVRDQSQFWDVASADASPAETEVQTLIRSLLHQEDWASRTVLDGGCGNGDYSAAFIALGAGRVTGIDVSAGSLITAGSKARGATFAQASLSELPFPTATIDVLWSWGVLHYVPNPVKAILEIGRVIKPGGVAVIHTLGANFWSALELSLQQVFSRAPRPVKSAVLAGGATLIPLITRVRTGKAPEAHTSKSVRQKLQERLLVPGKQNTFSFEELEAAFGPKFTVERARPPVADLLNRDMSLTIIVRKKQG
jgi:ubiquinone/menaquinone biosynthesis C-methylase UbiE